MSGGPLLAIVQAEVIQTLATGRRDYSRLFLRALQAGSVESGHLLALPQRPIEDRSPPLDLKGPHHPLICINAHQLLGQAHLFDDVSLNGQRHLPHL
jgi:hypothetical protein